MNEPHAFKSLVWIGSSRSDLKSFPDEVKREIGYALYQAQVIEEKGLTQAQIAERTALDQPKVSRLLRGHLSGFSADRLLTILNRLGHSVEVRISPKERPPEESHTRVMIR